MREPPSVCTHAYGTDPEAVASAREAMGAFALSWGATVEQAERIRLAVSEGVTNAILHGYRDRPGEVWVTAEVDGSATLSVVVCDEGVGMRPHDTRTGLGLGLGIVARVTDQMEIVPRPDGGTELHMRFALAARGRGRFTPALSAADRRYAASAEA